MTFFTHNMKLKFQTLGRQQFADDPKVVATLKTPDENLTFYMTEYRAKKDRFFGFAIIKHKDSALWVSISKKVIESKYKDYQELYGKEPTCTELNDPTPISELVPELKWPIMEAMFDRMKEQRRNEQEKDQDQGQEPER